MSYCQLECQNNYGAIIIFQQHVKDCYLAVTVTTHNNASFCLLYVRYISNEDWSAG